MQQLNVLSGLILTSLCLGAPQPQQQLLTNISNGTIEDAIDELFGPGNWNDSLIPTPVPGSLVDLVRKTFPNGGGSIKQGDNNNASDINLGFDNFDNTGQLVTCKCVPHYLCQNATINTSGIGLIDVRGGYDIQNTQAPLSVSGRCQNDLDVCCELWDILSDENRVTSSPMSPNGCGRYRENGVGAGITIDTNNTSKKARFGEFPWMVAILRKSTIEPQSRLLFPNEYQCGGALIHSQAVLTAAHCVIGKEANVLQVRAGEWDTQVENEIFPSQDRDVGKVIIHEKFNSTTGDNDFAILILERSVDLAPNVDTVCLPQQDDRFDTSRCFASGWGKDVHDGRYQTILKKIELLVVPRDICQNSLRHSRLGRHFVLSSSFICASGGPGNHSCKGDGGGPLVCPLRNDPTRYVQAGITAWGIRCGHNGMPGAYANVADARKWIDQKIANNNLPNLSYTY